MTGTTAHTQDATRLIDSMVTAARAAQMVLGTSRFATRQVALREAAKLIRTHKADLLATNKKDLAAAVKLA